MKHLLFLSTLVLVCPLARAADDNALIPQVEALPTDAKATKVVLIAGSTFFKVGEHDYVAACAVLMDLLKQTPNVAPVLAIDWPKKKETLEGAKVIVFFLDGGAKHPLIKEKRFEEITALATKGTGIVQLHQIADYPKDFGDRARQLTGAAWEPGYSARAHWVHEFKEFPAHPVTSGIKSFKIDDGWLTKLRFAEGMKNVTPLLRTADPKKPASANPDFDIVAWTYDSGKHRSFTFTGGHLHASFAEEGYRKFLVNGILWSANLPIPKDGAKVDLDTATLPKYLKAAPKK